jgi:hypothetical protein
MTPREKAEELVDNYIHNGDTHHFLHYTTAKQCALIAVDEILDVINTKTLKGKNHNIYIYYLEVKQEINLL